MSRANRVWPEAYEEVDTKPLWNDKQFDLSNSSLVTTLKATKTALNEETEGDLPWRFVWRDYVALSYCWGDLRITREIIINGNSIQATENLEAALRQLRDSRCIKQNFKVWADAICIDQTNLEERGQQVGRMRDIYASAWHVIIWLGPEVNDSSLAMIAVKHLSTRMGMGNPLDGLYRTRRTIDARPLFIIWATYRSSMRREVYRSLYYFFSRQYWRRLWILQEVALGSRGSPVLCGTNCVLWQDIYNVSRFVELDQNRFGRDIIASVKPTLGAWSWEFARDRMPNDDRLEISSEFL
ncbi:hypothetical protein MMC28_004924 [Mycoblastus sanguinarius]|nr:hypothetical protein [Mycoblastus sanguinarius]